MLVIVLVQAFQGKFITAVRKSEIELTASADAYIFYLAFSRTAHSNIA